ncbi:MAG: GDCCVxC domain-containing (seleno)protein [Anaerolineales bacterium]
MTLISILRCPHCGFEKEEAMPINQCIVFYICAQCGTMLRPQPGNCCVFCSYGTKKCPSMQETETQL